MEERGPIYDYPVTRIRFNQMKDKHMLLLLYLNE